MRHAAYKLLHPKEKMSLTFLASINYRFLFCFFFLFVLFFSYCCSFGASQKAERNMCGYFNLLHKNGNAFKRIAFGPAFPKATSVRRNFSGIVFLFHCDSPKYVLFRPDPTASCLCIILLCDYWTYGRLRKARDQTLFRTLCSLFRFFNFFFIYILFHLFIF